MLTCRLWCSVLHGVQLKLPPPMNRLSSCGVVISAASANGLAGPNGLTGQVPSGLRGRGHELRRVGEHVVGAHADVVVPADAAACQVVDVVQVRRHGQARRELLRHVGADRLLVVARVEQGAVVVLGEAGEVVLRGPEVPVTLMLV